MPNVQRQSVACRKSMIRNKIAVLKRLPYLRNCFLSTTDWHLFMTGSNDIEPTSPKYEKQFSISVLCLTHNIDLSECRPFHKINLKSVI